MNFDTFKRTVQTFGASRDRWENEDADAAERFARSGEGKALIETERRLDEALNLFCPPACDGLTERLYANILNATAQRQFLIFLRYSAWLSVVFMIGGFYLGWHETRQNYTDMQNYLDALFDIAY